MEFVEEYRRCAAKLAEEIDYSDKRSVQASNKVVDLMYNLVRSAAKAGPDGVQKLISLLDDPLCEPWIAHQLLQFCNVSPEIEQRCLKIIEKLAEKSLGERYWLRDYRAKKMQREDK